ncbi:Prophage endopeptidase tail [Bacteroides uniformis]|nr:phage tail protein [Bacteroides uniformis]QUT36568.1 Prophage endopeptidase tail [Bacteroides uniformis]
MITLYNGNEKIILPVTDDSYSYNSVMGENSLTLYFSSEKYIKIPVGSYCDFAGERYSLKKDSNFTKEGTRKYEYTLLLETDQSDLKLWKIRNTVDNRIKFSYTATPREHLELFVANANRRSSGWKVGECVEGKEVTFEYNHTYILDGLNDFANQIGTEWQIINKTVHLRKVEYNKSSPLVLSYGKGNGFKTGVGRESGDIPVEIILVQGTDRNIDFSKYGSKELLLPKSQTLTYEGRTYKSSSDGLSVMRADKALTTGHEDSLDCSEIYPSRVGTVSSVIEVNAEDSLYDFIDNSIPDSLDFEDYLIDGENMTVIFQTGMLSGSDKEFEVKYYHKPTTVQGKTKPGKRFEIVPQEIDGITMPDGKIYTPQPGDSYAVFGIQLPDSYICDNKTQTGASWDMFREAAKFLYEHEDKKFTFTGTLDGIWAKKRWLQIGGKIILGGYVLFSDEHFMPEGSLIRITGVKRYVSQPYKPEIELSNTTVGASISSELNKPGQNEVVIEDRYKDALKFTKRRFRDAKETMGMLEDALLNFSEAINPVAVQTMQLLVGDESLQFRFVNSKTNPVTVNHVVTYDKETMVLHCPAGIIQHMTLGINTLSASHKANEYKYWDISEYNSPSLFEPEKKYYLYIKANKSASAGSFLLSETAIKLEQVQGYYHFLTGILNSEYEGERSFVTLYGFSEILPGRVTTDKIVSTDGNTYFDLLKGIISGKITFKSGSSGLYELSEWGDVNNLITQAQNTANTAVESAKNANTAVGNLNNYVNGAFADGIITEAEAKAIEKYINTVNNTKAAVEAAYNKLYTNAYLTGTAKTGLLNAKVTLMGSIENLISAINSAIADGRTTVTEKNNVDNKYATFNSAYADFNTAVEVANKAIQDKLKGYSDEYSQKFDEFIGGSFKDLKDNAVLKQTIIEGGYLKNDLIDTNNLIVKKVFSKDGKFKILDDGSMEGTSGTFSGYLKTNFHLVEESDAIYTKDSSQGQYGYKINKELNLKVDMEGESNGATIILPNEIQYIGSRVILHNGCYPPYTRTVGSIRCSSVCIDDGGQLRGTSSNSSESDLLSWADPNKITWINGVIELIGIIEKGTYSPSLLSWKGQSNKAIPNPSNGYMYYNTEKNRNYVYWFGQWNEIPTHENSPIIWKGKLDQAPENPEKNWVYISRYDSVFIYNGIRWEDISYYVITAEKCGWSVLSISGVSLEYTRY